MFGYVMANRIELDKAQQQRYDSVYCGICRQLRQQGGQTARLGLSYDMAFLALLLMSLYEPEETGGKRACLLRNRPYVENTYIAYAGSMNLALAYYKALDDIEDEGSLSGKTVAGILKPYMPEIENKYPRQCESMKQCIHQLGEMEKAGCQNPDLPAGCFGSLLGEILVYEEDMWAEDLRQTGQALGRFIYLADAAVDYRKDKKHNRYNPFLAMGMEEDWATWEQYLVLEMARCTRAFERLPLVQDKTILDNILYSGVWVSYRQKEKNAAGGKNDSQSVSGTGS